MEGVALAWWHCPPVTTTTSQGSGGLPACQGSPWGQAQTSMTRDGCQGRAGPSLVSRLPSG